MTQEIQMDIAAESILRDLRTMFAPHITVNMVLLNTPEIIEEFRPASVEDLDLRSVPKPSLKWAFGVECGAVHDNARIVALVFNSFSRLKKFYAKNLALHRTLITCWHGAAAIWLRATGRVPRNFAADDMRWCASGTIPVGCPKQPADTFLSQPAEIKQVDFGKLVWSEQQLEAVERCFLEMEVGPLLPPGGTGSAFPLSGA